MCKGVQWLSDDLQRVSVAQNCTIVLIFLVERAPPCGLIPASCHTMTCTV